MSQSLPKPRRIRAGLYTVNDCIGRPWTIEQRKDYTGTMMWFATCDEDRWSYLDPIPTLRDAARIVAS